MSIDKGEINFKQTWEERITQKLDHIRSCAEIWEGSGVSRVKAILRTTDEIQMILGGTEVTR